MLSVGDDIPVPVRPVISERDPLTFQIVDIHLRDEPTSTAKKYQVKHVMVNVFGRTASGAAVCLKVTHFRPSFYIRTDDVRGAIEVMETLGSHQLGMHDVQWTTVKALPFVGYQAQPSTFLHVSTRSLSMRHRIARLFWQDGPLCIRGKSFPLFEAKLPSLLRFLHERHLSPVGWVTVAPSAFTVEEDREAASVTVARCHIRDVGPYACDDLAPLLVASFDIECYSEEGFPCAERHGDAVIQIGCVVQWVRDVQWTRYIWVLGTCDPLPDTTVIVCDSERDLLLSFAEWLLRLDPDILLGYNIFGFDFPFLFARAKRYGLADRWASLSRYGEAHSFPLEISERSSAAMGDNVWHILPMPGRVHIDLYQVMKRDETLASYKLDSVALHFLQLRKHDVTPQQMWALHKGSSADRAVVAAYCVQDCVLPLRLLHKLDILIKKRGMAHVCCVPLSFIFNRGQGIKLYSLVTRSCRELGYVLADIVFDEESEGYAGAIVLKPVVKAHFTPVAVNDFNSLYPSAAIGSNLCPTTLILDQATADTVTRPVWTVRWRDIQTRDPQEWPEMVTPPSIARYFEEEEEEEAEEKEEVQAAEARAAEAPDLCIHGKPEWTVWETPFTPLPTWSSSVRHQVQTLYDASPVHQHHFVQPQQDWDGPEATRPGRGVVPRILIYLLDQRAHYKRLMDAERDPFQKSMLNALQLSYKVTANSLYGQMGARTSAVRCQPVASSITATGRMVLLTSAAVIVERFPGATIVYGDTDSLFVQYPVTAATPVAQREEAIRQAEALEEMMKAILPYPHRFQYEKTYHPFLLLNKKKYTGLLYEHDATTAKKTDSKGLVNKRRDNAPIVQVMYNKLIASLLHGDAAHAIATFRHDVADLLHGRVGLEHLTISKTLKQKYKVTPGHALLAARMRQRDPGSAPQVGDRVPYVFVAKAATAKAAKASKQADVMEHPDFVVAHRLPVDYMYYLQRQVLTPIHEILALFDAQDVVADLIRDATNKKHGLQDISRFFIKK